VGKKPKPDARELEELKAHLADHEERVAAIEAACRAFAVVFALPRITDKTGDSR